MLAGAVRDSADQPGRRAQAAQVNRYQGAWENAIFPQDHPFSGPAQNVRVPDVALEALAALADHLHHVAPEGIVPDGSELHGLKTNIGQLADEVNASDELPGEVKHVIAARLAGVLLALDHIAIGGPNAVRLATEVVAGAITVRDSRAWRSGIGRKICGWAVGGLVRLRGPGDCAGRTSSLGGCAPR